MVARLQQSVISAAVCVFNIQDIATREK